MAEEQEMYIKKMGRIVKGLEPCIKTDEQSVKEYEMVTGKKPLIRSLSYRERGVC